MLPSTALLCFRRWLNNTDIWHFHNLHGHYLSIPLLSLLSWKKRIVISPVDKYLSTGYCPYPMDCDRFLTGCGKCQQLDDPWPGISRDATKTLWKIKRFFIPHSRFNLLFHTQALADHYGKTFVARRPGRVMHYGIDINCFRKLDQEGCYRKFALETTSRFVIGLFHSYVIEPRKGIVPIIKKLGELGKLFPGRIELLVVGRGGHEVKNIAPPELSITILPYLRHQNELANALNLCDVLLYPTKAENLSLTCLYSLACGVPVISYDAGGQREAIKNGYNGFIVDIGDEDRMIKNLIEMINNPLLCKQLSDNARSTAEKQFDFDNYVDDLIAYYREII
jgi:glycosyltransferase involved in cell wall biosynthesis